MALFVTAVGEQVWFYPETQKGLLEKFVSVGHLSAVSFRDFRFNKQMLYANGFDVKQKQQAPPTRRKLKKKRALTATRAVYPTTLVTRKRQKAAVKKKRFR